jgi:hypothetical protein
MAIGKLKINYKDQSTDWKPEHSYLKFCTSLTPSMEKIWIFVGSSKFITQEIEMFYLVIVGHNSMATHLTRSDCGGC